MAETIYTITEVRNWERVAHGRFLIYNPLNATCIPQNAGGIPDVGAPLVGGT